MAGARQNIRRLARLRQPEVEAHAKEQPSEQRTGWQRVTESQCLRHSPCQRMRRGRADATPGRQVTDKAFCTILSVRPRKIMDRHSEREGFELAVSTRPDFAAHSTSVLPTTSTEVRRKRAIRNDFGSAAGWSVLRSDRKTRKYLRLNEPPRRCSERNWDDPTFSSAKESSLSQPREDGRRDTVDAGRQFHSLYYLTHLFSLSG
jgi:hypothetical protein